MKSPKLVAVMVVLLSSHWASAQQIPAFTKVTQGALVTDRLDSY